MRSFLCPALLAVSMFGCAVVPCAGQNDPLPRAIAELQAGNLASAENILTMALQQHPNDGEVLEVLGLVLDQEKKYADADPVYRRALALSPSSLSLLNNYGNHLVATGKVKEARAVFLQVLARNPAEVNACTQLARMALQRKVAAETSCLERLPASAQENPDLLILRMQAGYALGRTAEANALLARLSRSAETNTQLSFSVGVALSAVGQYDKAESFFARTVDATPGNFDALYDLGLAASHAGHNQRARDVLRRALQQQPENVDVLYDLAAVTAELGQRDTALELLARAARIAPQRADVQMLLARTAADIGDFADAAESWKKYMILAPKDDIGRREHAFAESAFAEHAAAGIADLEWYVRAHPNDPIGHYELAAAESAARGQEAMRQLNRALVLKPDLTAAHVARGLLNYRLGKPAMALPDFEFAVQHDPANPRILDRLGETYTALDRPTDALRVFRKASELAPRDSAILLHLARALTNAGQTEEAKIAFAHFRELGPNTAALPHPAGLVEFLSLSPEEQFARYRAGVERTVQQDPTNADAQVRYLQLLLQDARMAEAVAVSRKILARRPSAALLEQTAGTLLAAERYSLADDFLKQAVKAAGPSPELKLDMAIATFHVAGAQAGLEQMDRIAPGDRNGDYFLARMQILNALGETAGAANALKEAVAAKPTHPELYRQAALLLLKEHRITEAAQLLDKGARLLPNDSNISLLRVIVSQAAGAESERLLNDFAARWPVSHKLWSETR